MTSKQFVYHASRKSGLRLTEPHTSTHRRAWVYATEDIPTSAMFLGDNNDFICQTGIEDGMPCVCERFQGALELAYSGKSGSIYGLASAHFTSDQTTWPAEVVSDQPEKVLEEIGVEDALVYLRELEKEGKLR